MTRARGPRAIPWLVCISVAAMAATVAMAQDADGDGMSDALERVLATDPEFAEELEPVAESPLNEKLTGDQAHFDLTRVRFGNVAQGRWLWALEFAVPYTFENTSLILYVDADNNPETGREGMGCETTYGHSGGRPTQMFYLSDQERANFPAPRVVLEDGVLYICADLPLNQAEGRSKFRMMILSEQRDPHESRDSLGWRDVDGPGDSDREKVITLADLTENENFEVTQSAELLWQIQADERNIILNAYRDGEYQGFVYYHSEYRWPALRKAAGESTITATVPRGGRFYPGVVVYDSSGPEAYEMSVDGEVVGRFAARADNRRQRLFLASKPIDFKGGEKLVLRASNTGAPHIVEEILLLPERPPVVSPACEIRDLEVGWDWERGCMRATWWTTWPTVCSVDVYNGAYTILEDEASQNHRAYLPPPLREPEENELFDCEVSASDPHGNEVTADGWLFLPQEPSVPRGAVAREQIELRVVPDVGRATPGLPLTAGIPFAQGALGTTDHLRLIAPSGLELRSLQARPLARWPDGSVKVALIDTLVPYSGTYEPGNPMPGEPLILEYGYEVRRDPVHDPIEVSESEDAVTVRARYIKAEFRRDASGLFTRVWADLQGDFGDETLITRDDAPAKISIIDDEGNVYDILGPPDSIVVEEAGPLRAVVRLDGHHTGPAGEFFTYQIRVTLYALLEGMRMSYRWGNDVSTQEFTNFRRIRFELPLALGENAEFAIGADEPVSGKMADGGRLEQFYDDRYTAGEQAGERAPGWVAVADGKYRAAMICRDFWQLYPKAMGAEEEALYLDICPEFPENQYNDCSEMDLMKLYYYLQDGRYKVRQGVTKTHDVWLFLVLTTEPLSAKAYDPLAAVLNEAPILAASPDYYASTGVFGDFVPKTAGTTPRYDEVCDRVYDNYVSNCERSRNYGMLNYGDQFGERRVNWANGEYDYHHTAAQMFVRSAEPGWHYLMEDTARHDIDVDLCHYHTNPGYRGASWVHAMGHTGRYFDKQYQGEWGIPGGGMSVSHTWCEGTCEYYMLTGDPTAIEAARMIADHYGGTYLNDYDFTNGRIPGWHLILTMAVYRTTYDPYYLNAARIIVDRTLERRTPGSGWERQLVPGHCHCEPRCRGACSFMQGILGVGLREYYLETEDERIPEAVVDSARYVIDEMWVEEQECFRYTSCPESSVTASRSDTLAGLLLFAHELSGDPLFSDIAQRSMNLGFEHLGSMAHLRWTPYIIRALDRLEREGIGVGGERPATIRLQNEEGQAFEVRLCDREGKGAPAGAAELIAPDGSSYEPDDSGRIRAQAEAGGVYRLRTGRGSGPWQVTSSLNRMVLALGGGADLAAGPRAAPLHFLPAGGGAEMELTLEVLSGSLKAQLLDPSGTRVASAEGGEGRLTLSARAGTDADGLCQLVLLGPATLRLRATGVKPWAALSPGRYFNASAPSVTVTGEPMVLPGEGRTVTLQAETEDPEDDVVSIRWELPEGRTAEGAELTYEATEADRFKIRAIATDAEGNSGSTTIEVSVPPAELAEAEGLIIVQAEDFAGQGGGEVRIYERIGNVGKMITYWHEQVGHWLEWEFEAPGEGDYVVYARYASGGENPRRSLTIDGESPGAAYEDIGFEPTGGYCTESDNWAVRKLGPPVHLGAGAHRLRMTNLGDGLAMDYLAIAKAQP